MSNVEQALDSALRTVSRDLGTAVDYEVKAHLYKLLLYEEGCFFARHRDSERLDGMFATLVLELPSVYEGAELSVFSPLTPNEKATYTFNGVDSSFKRKRRSPRLSSPGASPGLFFAAFYADCYHEVSKLTSGHRVALVYHLTATPFLHPPQPHLPLASPSPSQPADEFVARRLSKLVELFSREKDDCYPRLTSLWRYDDDDDGCHGKPKKLAVVLSHHYSPASLTGIQSLKGSDRSIAELIRAAAHSSPADADVPSLARLSARKVVEAGGERYATDPEHLLAHELVSNEYKGINDGPYFDAVISLATVWDSGELTPDIHRLETQGTSTFRTTGPLISLTGEHVIPLDLGPELPEDRAADYHPSWFGGQDDRGPPFQYEGPSNDEGMPDPDYDFWGPPIYGEQFVEGMEDGNHSLPVYSHELLFASEEASNKYRKGEMGKKKHVVLHWPTPKPESLEFCECGLSQLVSTFTAAHFVFLSSSTTLR